MTVSELIQKLQALPQHLPVAVNDEAGGTFYDTVDDVFHCEADPEYGDPEQVVICLNTKD